MNRFGGAYATHSARVGQAMAVTINQADWFGKHPQLTFITTLTYCPAGDYAVNLNVG